MKEAVLAGFIFIKTASEGILTKDTIPPQFMPSVEDTEKKASLYVRHGVTEQAARSTGAEKSVKQHVAAFEGRDSPCAQTGEVASNQTCASSETSGSTTSNSKAYGAERKTAAKETPPKPSEAAATTAPKSHGAGSTPTSHGAGSTPKSLGKETTPKQQPAAPKKEAVTAVKIEVGSCSRCFAQTFKGQIQCDVCGLTL